MFQPGGVYTKCGVLLEDLTAEGAGQADLFATADPKAPALLAAMDGLNSRFGRNTVILAAQGCGARSFDTKRSQKSTAWTTRSEEHTSELHSLMRITYAVLCLKKKNSSNHRR